MTSGRAAPRLLRRDLGVRVGHREDDRVARHRLQHLARDDPAGREADEDVGARQRVGERALGRLDRELRLVGVHVRRCGPGRSTPLVDAGDRFSRARRGEVELRAGDGRGAGAGEDDLDVLDLLADDLERVQERGGRDDRRAVLVVVEDRDLQPLLQRSSISKHSGALMSSRLMPPKVGSSRATVSMIVVRVLRVELDVEDVDVGEPLEEDALALHDRLAGERADVAEAEHGGAVRDDGDEVALARVLVDLLRVLRDREAGLGDAGGVGEREVLLRPARLGGDDLDLPLAAPRVVLERLFGRHAAHGYPFRRALPAAPAPPRARRPAATVRTFLSRRQRRPRPCRP